MKRKAFLFVLLFGVSAEGYCCPPGSTLQQGVGWQMCVPIPGMTGNEQVPSSQVEPRWLDRWGAIAVDWGSGNVGIGASSALAKKSVAEKQALTACRAKGGTKCAVEFTYRNQCAVVVWGEHSFNASGGASLEEATRVGMEKCKRANESNCEIYYSDCSFPQRIQ